ncbi:MAG: patatin-like phospholipase family protein [Victivallaceae bacterium]|nr:patatin-like phospholipase family protein [Victivallaceae bacterium]
MRKRVLAIIHGGGCRQIENATGIFKAMDEAGIKIDLYRGASAGAIVAAMHASGLTGDQMEQIIWETPTGKLFSSSWWQWTKLLIPGVKTEYVYSTDGLEAFLKEHVDLIRVLLDVQVSVSRLPDYESLMMNGSIESVMASAAIPEVFPPVEIDGRYYVDGGVINNIPTCKLRDVPKYEHIYILLCNQDTKTDKTSWTKVGRSLAAVNMAMDREVHQILEEGWNDFDNVTVIQPPPFRSHLLEWSEDFSLIEHSYKYAKDVLAGRL